MISNEHEIRQRINELVEDSGLKKSKFAIEAGIDASNFNKKLSGKLKFTDADIKLILAYTNTTTEWLLFGKGQKHETNEIDNEQQIEKNHLDSNTVKGRLKLAMEALGLSPLAPASICQGITKNMMQKLWNSETNTVTTNILEPFCNHFTQVNCNWLMRGTGSMFISEELKIDSNDGEKEKIHKLEARIASMSHTKEQQDKAYELILSMLDVVSKTYDFFENK